MAERRVSITRPPAVGWAQGARAAAGLRLHAVDVAGRTGAVDRVLSQVERDITARRPFRRCADRGALGTRINDSSRTAAGRASSWRRAPRAFRARPSLIGYERLSTSFPGQALNAIRMHVPPGYRSEVSSHAGEEFVFVLAGTIRYLLADRVWRSRRRRLAAFFGVPAAQGREPHRQVAEVLTVVTQNLVR